jgi:predicted ATPase
MNFRSYKDGELPLQTPTLLIGPAGSGKSNFFKALVFLQTSIHRSLVEMFPPGLGEFIWVRNRLAQETDPVGIEVELEKLEGFPEYKARYHLEIAEGPENLYVLSETLSRTEDSGPESWVFKRMKKGGNLGFFGEFRPDSPTVLNSLVKHSKATSEGFEEPMEFALCVAKELSSFGYFHLDISQLKALGDGRDSDYLSYRGARIPDFLSWAKLNEPENFKQIMRNMKEILPDLEDIIITQVEPDRQGLAMSFQGHRGYIAAPDLSDGTMFTLGLVCIVNAPKPPRFVCIEEPETGIHPGRLRWLFDKLVGLSYPAHNEQPIQVAASTHSPYLLELFKDMLENVLLLERKDGNTVVSQLDKKIRQIGGGNQEDGIGHEWASGLYERL